MAGSSPAENPVSTPVPVAGETKKRRRRKRTTRATALRQINAKARERQQIWRERQPAKGDRHFPEDELRALDATRGLRTGRLGREIQNLYVRGAA